MLNRFRLSALLLSCLLSVFAYGQSAALHKLHHSPQPSLRVKRGNLGQITTNEGEVPYCKRSAAKNLHKQSLCKSSSLSPDSLLQEKLNHIHTFQADFSQVARDVRGRLVARSKGHCILKRPGYFFWQVNSPNTQTIYVNPQYAWVVDDDLMQATRQASASLITAQNPVSLLVGSLSKALSQYHVSRRSLGKDESYVLVPVDQDQAPFQELVIDMHGGVLSGMRVTNFLSGEVIFKFFHIKTNKPVADTVFHYTPSAEMDVLK